ncbi:MAG: UDP-N-acetylmuramoyl-tripeptide--D-alanyl-D-alanine ligase [Pseudomonadales bacterium]|nr:UDP-N-acetylmuramoyl-tripeptide--D-alanyl-D-alanine ligase [Pseudomonadales bacterium]
MIRQTSLVEMNTVLQGRLIGRDTSFNAVSTDTRKLNPGELYIALTGPNFDGNEFIASAAEKGACGAIVNCEIDEDFPQLQVADTTTALGQMGAWNRGQSKAMFLAITGSQGKTSVKEMTAAILRTEHAVYASRGNFNNAIGVPLSLLQIEAEHEFAVLELGASGAGEIAYTVDLVRPDISLINNAAEAHLEGFGSLSGVVAAKGEIIDGLGPEGVAVLNADDPAFPVWRQRAAPRKVLAFSLDENNVHADIHATNIEMKAELGSKFTLNTPKESIRIKLRLPGVHNVANALAAASVALVAGADLKSIKKGLNTVLPVAGRMQMMSSPQGARVIDDSYNANPSAFMAAIDVLASCEGVRILVAGDMAELGDESDSLHRQLGTYANQKKIDLLWTVGEKSRLASIEFGPHAQHFNSQEELLIKLNTSLGAGVTVLVKGSRSAGMDNIVKQIISGESS